MDIITIHVRGGVAELEGHLPPGVQLVIHDHDEAGVTLGYEPSVYNPPHSDQPPRQRSAAEALIYVYERSNGDSIDWEDLDTAYSLAIGETEPATVAAIRDRLAAAGCAS